MANRIAGITVEIGGDTTKLSKALESVNKKISSTQTQLKDVERLLKLDPTNTELLAQKQHLLTDAVSATSEKLNTLRTAAEQAQHQLERGDISQAQFDALQREIIATEQALRGYNDELEELNRIADETSDSLNDTGNSANNADSEVKGLGESAKDSKGGFTVLGGAIATFVGNALTSLVSSIGDAISTFASLSEETQEFRENMAKLQTATESAGMDADKVMDSYGELYGVLGDETATTTTISNFQKLNVSVDDMDNLLNSATGIWAEFGDSIPLDGLAESVNETSKVGQITGTMADAINWASASNEEWASALGSNNAALSAFNKATAEGLSAEDAYNAALAACSSEQERQQLIISTLNGLYGESADKYKENNASIIEARQASLNYQTAVAGVGAAMEPLMTVFTNFKATLISGVSPALEKLTTAFMGVVNGTVGAETAMTSAINGLMGSVNNMASQILPKVLSIGGTIVTGLMQGLIQGLPQLIATVSMILTMFVGCIGDFEPQLYSNDNKLSNLLKLILIFLLYTVFKSFYHPIKNICKFEISAYFSMIDMHYLTSFGVKANAYSPTSKFADNNTFMRNII